MASPPISSRVRFGVFEADLLSGELRKHGVRIKLHDQPFKVLAVLLEQPGEVVSRESLCQRLWPADVFVDSEVGLNSAIMKLRDALGDSAENPRFIETLPRRGYRLVVPVESIHGAANPFDSGRDRSTPAIDTSVTLHVTSAEQYVRPTTPGNGWALPHLPNAADPPIVPTAKKAQQAPARARALAFVAVVTIIAFIGIASWRFTRVKPGAYTIAVLPLKNLSPDRGSDYFSDGLTDEIISNLSVIDGLQVKSRTSSFAFKDKLYSSAVIGSQLNTNLILDGSVLRSGDRLRVNVQLIRVADDVPLWSGHYDRELKDIFAVQNEISRSIVNELRLNLGRGQRRYNTSFDAYDSYLKARELVNLTPGVDSESIAKSIPMFEAAIAKDPNFAPAYAGIADAYAYLSASPRIFSPEIAFPKMKIACNKAMELDPLLPEAYACMGLVLSRAHDWQGAEKSFRRAFELNPNLSRPREDYAMWVLCPLGKIDEALKEMHKALELDPLSRHLAQTTNFVLLISGRYDEVVSSYLREAAANPEDFSNQLYARALTQQGKLDESIRMLERLGMGSEGFLGFAYARAGRRAEAEQICTKNPNFPWFQALIYSGLGDQSRAIDGLKKMVLMEDPRAASYLLYPELAVLRDDPRLNEIRSALNLPRPQ